MCISRLEFNGRLRTHHRQRLREIRLTAGMTYRDFGNFIGCDWSTVLKWENGDSTRSHPAMTLVLQQIFQGHLDHKLYASKIRWKLLMAERLTDIIHSRRSPQSEVLQESDIFPFTSQREVVYG